MEAETSTLVLLTCCCGDLGIMGDDFLDVVSFFYWEGFVWLF